MKKVLLAFALAAPIVLFSQWKVTNLGNSEVKPGKELIEAAGIYTFEWQTFKQELTNAPQRFSDNPGVIISLPNVEGKMEQYEVWEASNFAPALQDKFPDIRSYVGRGLDDPYAYLRFSISPKGISSMTLRAGESEFIEPYTTDNSKFIVFNSKTHRNAGEIAWECSTPDTQELSMELMDSMDNYTDKSSAGVFKTFRLAQSVTGEYTQHFGGTVADAMAAINNTLTRVNGVFEKDFAVNLILIDNNEEVIFTNPSTDPYSPPSGMNNWNVQLRNTLDSIIGPDNYDIGHLYGHAGGGGNAGCIGCICRVDAPNNHKGSGYTSPGIGAPEGDNFDIDYVAHEYGHQLGANHTMSFQYEGTGSGMEPGSGSTIMGYAGITNWNVQQHSDDYFHYRSLQQVQANLQNKPCANNQDVSNTAPDLDAGGNYTVPKGTGFKLVGTASDEENDPLLFNWEQNNPGNQSTTQNNSRVSFTKTQGPNFRSLPHKTEPVRYMPDFDKVLVNDVDEVEGYWRAQWESITTVPRTYNFVFTARDNNPNGPQTATKSKKVTVTNDGPFKLTKPAKNENVDISNGNVLVEWDVNGTDGGQINTENVRISYSGDDGQTFTVVAESVPNNGSAVVHFPAGTTSADQPRILIEAIDNIYYTVSRQFNLTGEMGTSELDLFTVGIYPNPNNGHFYVKAPNVSKGNVATKIFDTSGKMVYNQNTTHLGGNYDKSYNVNLPSGVYIIIVETIDGKTTEKLIIK